MATATVAENARNANAKYPPRTKRITPPERKVVLGVRILLDEEIGCLKADQIDGPLMDKVLEAIVLAKEHCQATDAKLRAYERSNNASVKDSAYQKALMEYHLAQKKLSGLQEYSEKLKTRWRALEKASIAKT